MKIALYYPWIYLRSGCERTILQLVSRSRHDWTIYTNRFEPESTFPGLQQLKVVNLPEVSVRRSFGQVGRAALRIGSQRLPADGSKALVVFCEGLGDLITLRNRNIPAICLCFTPLRAAFDTHYQANYLAGRGNSLMRRTLLRVASRCFRLIDRQIWRRYRAVFAISSEVRDRIVAGGLRTQEQVQLAHPGVDLADFTPTGIYEKTFVIAGRIMWTKNIELGIEAFRRFVSQRGKSDFSLVIAGFVDEKSKPYVAKLRALSADLPNVRFVERPSDEELFLLCSSAYALLYTPFNEDWGLIPLEAMCLEKAVISVNRGGPCEVILDGKTGFLVPPDPDAFANAMKVLADRPDLTRTMGVAGRQRAAQFDWQQFCQQLDDFLETFANRSETSLSYAYEPTN